MRSIIVIEVFPFLQFLIKQLSIVNDYSIQHPIKLLLIDPMTAFHFPIESWAPGLNIHMIYPFVQNMPMELSLEFSAIVCMKGKKGVTIGYLIP